MFIKVLTKLKWKKKEMKKTHKALFCFRKESAGDAGENPAALSVPSSFTGVHSAGAGNVQARMGLSPAANLSSAI